MPETSELPSRSPGMPGGKRKGKEEKKGEKGKTLVGTSLDKALMIILTAKLTQLQASKMPKTAELPGASPPGPLPPPGFASAPHA